MLTCKEYRLLDEVLQAQFLWLDGVVLMNRCTERLQVELYALYNFYVEVFYDRHTEDPLYLKPFDRTDRLDAYLEQIPIEPVLAG